MLPHWKVSKLDSIEQVLADTESLEARVRVLEGSMDSIESLKSDAEALAVRISALEEPTPSLTLPPPENSGRITASRLRLIGGWRVNQPYTQPGMAIDFSTMTAYVGGHRQSNNIIAHSLPEMGTGEDLYQWPTAVRPDVPTDRFWDSGNARGVMVRDGKLWVSTKIHYDTSPEHCVISTLDLTTGDVERVDLLDLPKPAFGGGFIKGHPTQIMVGCGGYESGQGAVAGPTCALMDGTVLLDQANHGTQVFDDRTQRPANYSASVDSWMTLNPRDGIGRWAADRVYSGGIWRTDGLMFWPIQAVGDIDYKRQSETFSKEQQSMLYTYDPSTYDQLAYEPWPHGFVIGQDMDDAGRIYLLCRDENRISRYNDSPVIKVFEVA